MIHFICWHQGISLLTNSVPNLSEQPYINNALLEMNTVWENTTQTQHIAGGGWEGRGDDDIPIYLFPREVFCRKSCWGHSNARAYLLHPVASKSDLELKESVLKKSLRGFYNQMFSD